MSEQKVCPTCGTEYPMSERFCPRDGSALRSQNKQNDLVGTVVADRYHVIKKLGEGGMGAVYLAEHVKMGRKSAIKVMNPGMHQDADAIARFNREASNASRLNHPNICAIYDFGETSEGLIYLAMEYIEGKSLTALIEENGALEPHRAASIVHQAADALQVAHDYGIVHRDLKPDNIMITKDRNGADVAKVVDFGIAKASSSDAQKVTKTGLVVGTPEYMSPEQLAGDKLDGRSDLYSLALVAFNCFTGTLPFPSNSAQEAMIMRLTDQPKTLTDMKPDTAWPQKLQSVMDRALARDAKDRTSNAAEFGRDLSAAVESMPTRAVAAEMGTMVLNAATAQVGAVAAPAGSGGASNALPATRVAGKAERPSATATAATVQQGAVSVSRPDADEPVAKKGSMLPAMIGAGVLVVSVAGYFAMSAGKGKPEPIPNPAGGTAQTTQTVANPRGDSVPAVTPTGGSKIPGGTATPGGTTTTGGTKLPPTPTGGSTRPSTFAADLAKLRADAEDDQADNSADVIRRAKALASSAVTEKDRLTITYSSAMAHMKASNTAEGCPLLTALEPKAALIGVSAQVKSFLAYCK